MINTNGFITEFVKAVQNKEWLIKEETRLLEALTIPRQKIKKIEEEYKVKDLENKLKDVYVSRRDTANVIRYYYFRSIIDGVYNLLKEYGWKYCDETFKYLRKSFDIISVFDDGFEIFYVDDITCLNANCVLDLLRISDSRNHLRYSNDNDDEIKIPDDLDIMTVLNATEDFLKDNVKLHEEKEADEEYKTYLRLKEKYEGKNK